MKKIDLENWDRIDIYNDFKEARLPFYHLSSYTDVTAVRQFAKKNTCSFYSLMIWLTTRAANRIENFRYRRINDEIFLVDYAQPSFTTMKKGSNLYQITACRVTDDPIEFCTRTQEFVETQTGHFGGDTFDINELIYLSSVPWLDTTSISNAHVGGYDDSTPRICWGKFNEIHGKYLLNIFVEVNHQFIDGYHIGEFFRNLDDEIAQLAKRMEK